jgi:hypothetical protein
MGHGAVVPDEKRAFFATAIGRQKRKSSQAAKVRNVKVTSVFEECWVSAVDILG